jgi:hypothetical protein
MLELLGLSKNKFVRRAVRDVYIKYNPISLVS